MITTGYKWAYSKETLNKALNIWNSGKINLRSLITHYYNIDQIEDAFLLLKKRSEDVIKIAVKF